MHVYINSVVDKAIGQRLCRKAHQSIASLEELVAPHSFLLPALLVGATAKGQLQHSAPVAWRDSLLKDTSRGHT